MKRSIPFAVSVLLLSLAAVCFADVDLVTIPRRESTQLTIYNSDDITMVRETRLLTVDKGINRIQFSWANTLIDPTSIDFRVLDHADAVDLKDTTFPAGRTDALQWDVKSDIAGQVPVEIRYFTSGITWTADYVGLANADETKLNLTGYVRVFNNSGEDYDHAQVRLVVGTINLVEKIADLAHRPPPGTTYPHMNPDAQAAARTALAEATSPYGSEYPAYNMAVPGTVQAPPQVIKQGLSEYFLFTLEGQQFIKDGEPQRMVSLSVKDVPLECLYRLTDREGGTAFAKFYRFKNSKLLNDDGTEKKLPAMENLGLSPLPDGEVRLFSEYTNKDLAYVGGTGTKYVPIGDRLEVRTTAPPDITYSRKLMDQQITNLVSRQYDRRIDTKTVELFDQVDYDETYTYEEDIINGNAVTAMVDVERQFDDNVTLWTSDAQPKDWDSGDAGTYVDLHAIAGKSELVDATHVKYYLNLKPGEKAVVSYTVTYKRRKVGPELNAETVRRPL